MKAWKLLATALAATVVATPASGDTVCEWMEFAQAVETAAAPAPGSPPTPDHGRVQTQVALAMFEALNAIDRRYETYVGMAPATANASQDAAAVTAASKVLLAHYPAQSKAIEESYSVALEQVTDRSARDAGVRVGEAAAAAALKTGSIDPAVTQSPYLPVVIAGSWVPTQLPVIPPFAIAYKPWILPGVSSVRPAAPPALSSERWVRDYDEVRRIGGKDSKDRSPHQTLMARYRVTPNMMPSFRLAADAPGRSLVQNARMFAMANMIADDSSMATAEAKLHYNYWRPITAIRNGDTDGNDATAPDRAWEPLVQTPNHPEYPCGHCTYAGAVAEFMSKEVGPRPAYGVRVASRSLPGAALQALPTWDDWAHEVSLSRTLGGVHYRFSNEAGEKIGRDVARMAMANIMRPLPKPKRRRR